MANFKILSANVGYFLNFSGGISEYIFNPTRGLVGDRTEEDFAINNLIQIIEQIKPDLMGLVEIDQGSIRTKTDGQANKIRNELNSELSYRSVSYNKYGEKRLLTDLPILNNLSNGVLVNGNYSVKSHYLNSGFKRSVIEIQIRTDLSAYFVHLSMIRHTRKRQIENLSELISNKEKSIVFGDFNIYQGLSELDPLIEPNNLNLISPGETIPKRMFDELFTDTRRLDLFLCSDSIDIMNQRVIDERVSDHHPILLDINI